MAETRVSVDQGNKQESRNSIHPEGPESKLRYFLPAFVAFVLRIEWMLISGSYAVYRGDPFDVWLHGFEMGSVARSVAHGLGYSSPFDVLVGQTGPTSWVTPLYPFVISAVIRLFGDFSVASNMILLLLNCALSALTCIPIYFIAETTLGRRVSWLATWCWALVPYFNRWHSWIWDVNLSALLLATMFWLTLRANEQESFRSELALGGVAGIAALSNPALLSFIPVSLGWMIWRRRRRNVDDSLAVSNSKWRVVIVVCVAMVVIVMPWIVRNRLAFGHWVFLRTNFGSEFYLTNQHGLSPGEWLFRHPSINWYEGSSYRTMGELSYNRDRMERAVQYLRDYPGEFVQVSLFRASAFWSGSIQTPFSDDRFWRFWLYVPLSAFGLAGVALMVLRRNAACALYLGLILLYPLVFYVTYPLPRQRHAIEPILLVSACFAVVEFFSWITRRWPRIGSSGFRIQNRNRAGGLIIAIMLLACGSFALVRATRRTVEAFSPQPVLLPDKFIERCGRPDEQATYNNTVELDYQKAKVRVRIIDDRYGWVFDRQTGNLASPAESLGCWKHSATKTP